MRAIFASILLLVCLNLKAIDASFFGFDPNSADNDPAFALLEQYANSNKTVTMTFATGGVYNVTIPSGRIGAGQGAAMISRCTNVVIDANNVEFYCTNLVSSGGSSIFNFRFCTNVTITGRFRGDHTGSTSSGVKSVYLQCSNYNFTINTVNNGMFDGTRIGDFEDATFGKTFFAGNSTINVTNISTNTQFSVAVYLSDNININSTTVGTSGNYGSYRNVYISGSGHITAVANSLNAASQDSVDLITTAPAFMAPQHFGCSNVTFYATDLGSTNPIAFQNLVGFGVVSSTSTNVSIVHTNIDLTVSLVQNANTWTNNYMVAIQSYGTSASHAFSFTLRGTNNHSSTPRVNIKPCIEAYNNNAGLAYVSMTLTNFYDYTLGTAPEPTTVEFLSTNAAANIVTWYPSEFHNATLSNPSIQFLEAKGSPMNIPGTVTVQGKVTFQ